MIFLEKKFSFAEYRGLVEARDSGQCTDADRQDGGRFGDGNDCGATDGGGQDVAVAAKKAKERNVDVMLGGGKRVAVMDEEARQRAIDDFKENPKPEGSAPGSTTDLWDREFIRRAKGRVQKPKDGSPPYVSDGKIASTDDVFTPEDLRQNDQFVAHESVALYLSNRHEEERRKTGASGPGSIIDTAATEMPEQQIAYLVDSLTEDAIHAYDVLGVDPGFYSTDLESTMRQMTTRHPEFESDENSRFIFTTLLAITSSGQGPDANLRDADDLYRMFKEHGTVVPSDYGGGARDVTTSLKVFQGLLDSFGKDRTRRLLSGYAPAGTIEKTLERLAGKSKVAEWRAKTGSAPWSMPVDKKGKKKTMTSGELRDEVVPVAAIFGPKIGSFFANLSGRHEFLTMDRWLMRSVGRVSGELITRSTPESAKKRAEAALTALEGRSWSKAFLFGVDKSHGITKADLIRSLKIQQRTGVIEENGAAFIWATAAERSHQKVKRPSGGGYGEHPDPAVHSMHQAGNSLFKSLILEQQDPKTDRARRNIREVFRRVQDEVERRTGRRADIDEIQAALWQYEKRLWKHLGAKTNITENSLFSAAAEGVISGRIKREKPFQPASRRDADVGIDDFDNSSFDAEQAAWESNFDELGIDMIDVLKALEEDVEERSNFAALDFEQRDADCGREESGRFATKNQCQDDGGGGEDSPPPEKPSWMGKVDATGTTAEGEWFLEQNTKGDIPPWRDEATSHIVSLLDGGKKVKAFVHVDLSSDKKALYVSYAEVARPFRGRGVYKSLLDSMSEQFEVISDEQSNVAPSVQKAYESLGARVNRYGRYVLEKKKQREQRDAACIRQPGGRFGDGNKCQADGTGGGGVAAPKKQEPSVDNSWKEQTGTVSWSSSELAEKPPIRGGEKLRSLKIEGAGELASAMSTLGVDSLDSIVAIGGGKTRGADVRVSPYSDTEVFVTASIPIDPASDAADPDEKHVTTNTMLSRDRNGETVLNYVSLSTPMSVSGSANTNQKDRLRVASLLSEQFVESLSAAESAGVSSALTQAAGDSTDVFVQGYRLWPQFGFDGPVPPRELSKIPDEIVLKAAGVPIPPAGSTRIPQETVLRGLRARVKNLTIQQLISTREGERWWDKNGSDVTLTLDLKDKDSLGYRRFQEAKKRLARLKERNKSRAFFEDAESRDADCGRDEGGKFDGGNTCAATSNSQGESFRGVRRKGDKTQTKVARKLYQMRLSEGKLKDMVRGLGGKVSNTLVEIDTTRGNEGVNIFVRDRDNNESHVIHVGYYGATVFNSEAMTSSESSRIQGVVKAAMPSKIDDRLWARGTDFPVYVVNDPKTMSEHFGRVTAKQRLRRERERRSADCGRDDDGRFGNGNDCQGGAGTAVAAPGDAWKESSSKKESWTAEDLKSSSPIAGGEKMRSIVFKNPAKIAAGLDGGILPEGSTIDDLVAIGGGAVRDADLQVSGTSKYDIEMSLDVPADPAEPDGWRVTSSVSVFREDEDGGFFVDYGLLDIDPPQEIQDVGRLLTDPFQPPDEETIRQVTSVMMQRMTESLAAAQKLGAVAAQTLAIGSSSRRDKFKGYRLWPQFGFDGPIPPRSLSRLEESVDAAGLSPEAMDKWNSGEPLTVQDVIATREGKRWWDENGAATEMRLDFSDTASRGYQRFKKMLDRLPRLRDRNKSRDWVGWIDDLESRDADCGRDESGRFGPKNQCQEEGNAQPTASVRVSGDVSKSLDTLKIDQSDVVRIAGAEGGSVFMRPAPDMAASFSGASMPVLVSWEKPLGGIDYGLSGSSAVGTDSDGEPVLYHSTITVEPGAADTPAKKHAAARAFYEVMAKSIEEARKSGFSEVRFNAAGSKSDKSWKGYTIWPRMGFDAAIPADLREKLPDSLSHAKSLLDLHATREGTEWWANNGREVDISFRLGDPGSPQAKIMARWLKKFGTNRRDMPLGAGDGWLSPADLARFDELWDEIWDEGDLDEYEWVEKRSADCGRTDDGKFGRDNKCQEDAGPSDKKPVGKKSYHEAATPLDVKRIRESVSRGDIEAASKNIKLLMEVMPPSAVAREFGFTSFDADGSFDKSAKKQGGIIGFLRGDPAESASRHLAKLMVASQHAPELKSASINFMPYRTWLDDLAEQTGIKSLAKRMKLFAMTSGVKASCDLTTGELRVIEDRAGDEKSLSKAYERGWFSTDDPSHYVLHEYAHRLQHDVLASWAGGREKVKIEDIGRLRQRALDAISDIANNRYFRADHSQPQPPADASSDMLSRAMDISQYGMTDPLEFLAEYWTGVTLGYVRNDEQFDEVFKACDLAPPKKSESAPARYGNGPVADRLRGKRKERK